MGITTFSKFEKKALKLKDCIAVELEERTQVDNVINFFAQTRKKFMGDSFYRLEEGETQNSSIEPREYSSLDPKDYRDDAQSNFSAPNSGGSEIQSYVSGIQFQNKSKMSKKDIAAFMKSKLAHTKISNEARTLVNASGPT